MSHRLVIAVVLCGLLAASTFAQPSASPSKALLEDAASYAAQNKVSLDEAVRRLSLQDEIGRLEETLAKQEPSFAGLWIEHGPEFKIVVRFQDPAAEGRLRARMKGTGLARVARETRLATVSLAQLEKRRASSKQRAKGLGFDVDMDINVKENRVEMYSTRAQGLRAAIANARAILPERVEVVAVPELAQPTVLRGGEGDPGYCSGGFTVRNADGSVLGISTAGHCGNVQLFQGMALPLVAEYFYDAGDAQWHSACGYTDVSNEFNSGLGYRACTGQRLRSQQAIGTYVCKNGNATGRTCGYIQSKSYNPSYIPGNGEDSYIRVNGYGATLSAPGDSGSPWFVENLAYGITSGAINDGDAIYMAVDYLPWVGAYVLTYDPGPGCSVPPVATFGYNASSTSVDFNASGSYDPDGSIVSYAWNFGDGTTGSGATTNHVFPYEGYFTVTLTVTDNTGKIGQSVQSVYAGTYTDPCGGDPCCGTYCCGNPYCLEP
ncbi:MAG TPA: PKD domain-containing protein [Thermoanaerobaculia bacterium]|jgi:PKD repeat protein|nr:PKD domain-containing protein [Thermoanaerobaculia bacterium]